LDYFVLSNNVGLVRYPDNWNQNIKNKILSRTNANNVNKGGDVQYSRTCLRSRCSKGQKKL